jgi:hypothetical protein
MKLTSMDVVVPIPLLQSFAQGTAGDEWPFVPFRLWPTLKIAY